MKLKVSQAYQAYKLSLQRAIPLPLSAPSLPLPLSLSPSLPLSLLLTPPTPFHSHVRKPLFAPEFASFSQKFVAKCKHISKPASMGVVTLSWVGMESSAGELRLVWGLSKVMNFSTCFSCDEFCLLPACGIFKPFRYATPQQTHNTHTQAHTHTHT